MNSIFLLDPIDSRNNDVLVAYYILRLIEFKKAYPEQIKVCHVIFTDDATGLFRRELEHRQDGKYSPLALILDTARKYNIILVISIHNPSLVMESLHNECKVKILFKMNDAEQTNLMARKMGIDKDLLSACFWLPEMSRIISLRGIKPFMYYGLLFNNIPGQWYFFFIIKLFLSTNNILPLKYVVNLIIFIIFGGFTSILIPIFFAA